LRQTPVHVLRHLAEERLDVPGLKVLVSPLHNADVILIAHDSLLLLPWFGLRAISRTRAGVRADGPRRRAKSRAGSSSNRRLALELCDPISERNTEKMHEDLIGLLPEEVTRR